MAFYDRFAMRGGNGFPRLQAKPDTDGDCVPAGTVANWPRIMKCCAWRSRRPRLPAPRGPRAN